MVVSAYALSTALCRHSSNSWANTKSNVTPKSWGCTGHATDKEWNKAAKASAFVASACKCCWYSLSTASATQARRARQNMVMACVVPSAAGSKGTLGKAFCTCASAAISAWSVEESQQKPKARKTKKNKQKKNGPPNIFPCMCMMHYKPKLAVSESYSISCWELKRNVPVGVSSIVHVAHRQSTRTKRLTSMR